MKSSLLWNTIFLFLFPMLNSTHISLLPDHDYTVTLNFPDLNEKQTTDPAHIARVKRDPIYFLDQNI